MRRKRAVSTIFSLTGHAPALTLTKEALKAHCHPPQFHAPSPTRYLSNRMQVR